MKKAEKTKLADILHEMLTGAHDPIGGFPHNKVFARKLIGTERFENLQYARIWPFSCLFCCVPTIFIGYTMLCMFTTSMQVPLLIRLTPRS